VNGERLSRAGDAGGRTFVAESAANQTDAPVAEDTRSEDLREDAVRSLAEEVVARLARRGGGGAAESPHQPGSLIDAFCTALLDTDQTTALGLGRQAMRDGLDFDRLCEIRLAPAARRLGELWEEDELSFAEVTLATSRLFFVLRKLAPRPSVAVDARSAVFATPPGEEHLLGVTMAAERARAVGWHVDLVVGGLHDEIVDRIAAERPEVVGLSVGSDRTLAALSRLVVALRIAVPHVPVVICGSDADRIARARDIVGADAVAQGFTDALDTMDRLVEASRQL